jgi:hypothetical protein
VGGDGDCDTDRHWVETLLEGARMLCRLALSRPGLDGLDEVKEAEELIEKAKTRLDPADKELVARVALAEGIWNTVTAHTGQLPRSEIYPDDHQLINDFPKQDCPTRTTRLSNALTHCIKSVEMFPTPDSHHQLALALTAPGPSQSLEDAISSARAAVEGASDEIRHWHLLALLLTAQGQWSKAKGVLEVGAAMSEALSDIEEHSTDGDAMQETTAPISDGVTVRDFEVRKTSTNGSASNENGHIANGTLVHQMLLDPDAVTIPPSATLLQPLPEHPNPSPRDAFEYALQLRLTQMALTEHVEGPEGAEGKWVDVFGWIAERKGSGSESQCT